MQSNDENCSETAGLLPNDISQRKSRKSLKVIIAAVTLLVGTASIGIIAVASSSASSGETVSKDVHSLQIQQQQDNNTIPQVDENRLLYDSAYRLEVVNGILDRVPLIDGHNDLPLVFRTAVDGQVGKLDLRSNLAPYTFTDIPRLREGKLGGQFWSVYTGCSAQYKDAVQNAMEQIATIKSMIRTYADAFELVTAADSIQLAHSRGKIASMLGMEGGHMIGDNLGVLGQFYELGVRYLTLTHNCNTVWAESCCGDATLATGLTSWGKEVIHEMNRLGMFVDLAHVSAQTMSDALDASQAPVIFSHSGAYALCNHPRNVPDDILRRLSGNGGIIMATFFGDHVNCTGTATLSQVADHIEHMRSIAGVDHIGIGGDFDGFAVASAVVGLEDVSTYPHLLTELIRRGWSVQDIEKLAGLNLIRVFKEMEQVRDSMVAELAADTPIDVNIPDQTCRS